MDVEECSWWDVYECEGGEIAPLCTENGLGAEEPACDGGGDPVGDGFGICWGEKGGSALGVEEPEDREGPFVNARRVWVEWEIVVRYSWDAGW